MTNRKQSISRRKLAGITRQLAAVQQMTVGQLRDVYREVFGVPTRSRNREYLRKKVAYGIQEQNEGGLSERALAKIADLAGDAPVRHRPHRPRTLKSTSSKSRDDSSGRARSRDSRLPAPGTVITREHQGVAHRVTVLESGFRYDGGEYRSLSQVARAITGTNWNGYTFFGLHKRRGKAAKGGRR